MTNEQLCLLAQNGDNNAQEELYLNILPGIRKTAFRIAKTFSSLEIEPDDLAQEGSIGYLRAVRSFQSDQNVLFRTYAQQAVQNAMMDHIRQLQSEYGDSGRPQSLDSLTGSDDDLLDRIVNQHAKTPEQIYMEKETLEEIYNALSAIPLRESTYLYYRYGLGSCDEHDRTETAKRFHLNITRAKKLEDLALDHFRRSLRGDNSIFIYLHSAADCPI